MCTCVCVFWRYDVTLRLGSFNVQTPHVGWVQTSVNKPKNHATTTQTTKQSIHYSPIFHSLAQMSSTQNPMESSTQQSPVLHPFHTTHTLKNGHVLLRPSGVKEQKADGATVPSLVIDRRMITNIEELQPIAVCIQCPSMLMKNPGYQVRRTTFRRVGSSYDYYHVPSSNSVHPVPFVYVARMMGEGKFGDTVHMLLGVFQEGLGVISVRGEDFRSNALLVEYRKTPLPPQSNETSATVANTPITISPDGIISFHTTAHFKGEFHGIPRRITSKPTPKDRVCLRLDIGGDDLPGLWIDTQVLKDMEVPVRNAVGAVATVSLQKVLLLQNFADISKSLLADSPVSLLLSLKRAEPSISTPSEATQPISRPVDPVATKRHAAAQPMALVGSGTIVVVVNASTLTSSVSHDGLELHLSAETANTLHQTSDKTMSSESTKSITSVSTHTDPEQGGGRL